MTVGTAGTLSCHSSQRCLGNHHRVAEGHSQNDIGQNKNPSTVLCGQIGETPDITESHSGTGSSEDVSQFTGKIGSTAVLFVHAVYSFPTLKHKSILAKDYSRVFQR